MNCSIHDVGAKGGTGMLDGKDHRVRLPAFEIAAQVFQLRRFLDQESLRIGEEQIALVEIDLHFTAAVVSQRHRHLPMIAGIADGRRRLRGKDFLNDQIIRRLHFDAALNIARFGGGVQPGGGFYPAPQVDAAYCVANLVDDKVDKLGFPLIDIGAAIRESGGLLNGVGGGIVIASESEADIRFVRLERHGQRAAAGVAHAHPHRPWSGLPLSDGRL